MERKMMDLAFGAAGTVSVRGGWWVEDCQRLLMPFN